MLCARHFFVTISLDVTISASYNWSVAVFTTSLESQESYLTLRNVTLQTRLSITREFFRQHSVLSHGSIMLPPHQPRVFARLARWQLMSSKGSWEHVSPWEGLLLFSLRPTALACYTKQILRLPNLTFALTKG